ncbi:hypothetical protein [Desulfatiglans anilini]|uniref:hypothetical protein n=1 Tax=Desulfatiglans anilini TaxID=90728 RepID=UPI0012947F07|nr:hypothetical protein [Desulfatiglans anilini]
MFKFIVLLSSLICSNFIFSGCSIKVSSNYSPSILLDGEGYLTIGDFKYVPNGFEFDEKEGKYCSTWTDANNNKFVDCLEPYEIDTGPGLSPVYLDTSVSEFVSDAIKKELKFIGYKNTSDANVKITGEIREISIDYIGFSTVDFITKIYFQISDKSNAILFTKDCEGIYKSSKWTTMELNSGIYASLSKCIEDFVRSAQGNGVL